MYYIHYTLLHIITRVACCSYTVAAAQLTVAAIHHISRQLHAITYITYITHPIITYITCITYGYMHYTPLHDLHTVTWQAEPALTLHK